MSDDTDAFVVPLNHTTRERLQTLHSKLLNLHKTLLDDERVQYERQHGRVDSSGQMLNLVMFDKWFDWLHRISELIVAIDELQENDESTLDDAYRLMAQIRSIFKNETEGNEFSDRYRACLQREPAAVLAHAEVQRILFTDS